MKSHAVGWSVFTIAALTGRASAQVIERVDTDSSGAQSNGSMSPDIEGPVVSDDGRFVAFHCDSALVPSGAGIFVKDRATGAVACASVPTGGGVGKPAFEPAISGDGRYVAFMSNSNSLVANDTNGSGDVFVHDLATVTTTRVSISSAGVQSSGPSAHPSISGDVRYVAFQSYGANLAPNDANGATLDVFVHDRATSTTELISVPSVGSNGPQQSSDPYISRDGRFVAFESFNDLDSSLAGPLPAIFVRDRASATTRRVSLDLLGAPSKARFAGMNSAFARAGGISGDGRFVVYWDATNVNGPGHLLRRDLTSNAVDVVSVTPNGAAPSSVGGGQLSHDGRFVAFHCRVSLTPDDVNGSEDVYVRDMHLGVTRRVTVEEPPFISILAASGNAHISPDGCTVVFESDFHYLVAGDTNLDWDVFAWDARKETPIRYCAAGVSVLGCSATLSTSGTASGSAGSGFTLTASNVEGQRSGMLIYGISGRLANPWGTSTMCVAPPRQRTTLSSSGGTLGQCNGVLALDWNAFVAANPNALGAPFTALTPTFAQMWIRDPLNAARSVLSNAIEFYACP